MLYPEDTDSYDEFDAARNEDARQSWRAEVTTDALDARSAKSILGQRVDLDEDPGAMRRFFES